MAEEWHLDCRQGQDIFSSLKDPDWLWRPPSQLVSGHSCVGIVDLKTESSLLRVTMSLSFAHRLVLKMFCYK